MLPRVLTCCEKKRCPTISRDQIQQTQTHTKNKNLCHAFFKSSSSCFSRAVLAACRRSNSYKLQSYHTMMAWLICVHHAGNLGMPHATKKVLEPSPTARLHSSSSLFHLPQSDEMLYLLSMLITLFYLHSARKHYKNMSFTGHMGTRIEHETFAKGCNTFKWHHPTSWQVCDIWPSSLFFSASKNQKTKKKNPTISIT